MITNARLRTSGDQYGQKLKIAFTMETQNLHEVCMNCVFDETGERVGSEGYVGEAGTCGGHPNGCYSVKSPALKFDQVIFDQMLLWYIGVLFDEDATSISPTFCCLLG